jgi:uncharacterized surface protein with fasciclin (FAS1) repeats
MIYGLSAILLPPPPVGLIISHVPTVFSTLSLGLERSGLAKSLKDAPHVGGTFFAPSNTAFKKLGPRINAFLFSRPGARYLKALLEYHIVANMTLYSNTLYDSTGNSSHLDGGIFPLEKHHCHDSKQTGRGPRESTFPARYVHIDLPTLLENHPLPVDLTRRGPWIDFKVNHIVRVAHQDGLAKNGVIQLVNTILIPPKKPRPSTIKADQVADKYLTVDDFKSRFPEIQQYELHAAEAQLKNQANVNWEL